MTSLGRQDGGPLIVDLRNRTIASWPELWDALMEPCNLPVWFGRYLDAWWDTIQTGGISATLDDHAALVVRVSGPWFLTESGGQAFLEVTNDATMRRLSWARHDWDAALASEQATCTHAASCVS
jgi:hypothetical protein